MQFSGSRDRQHPSRSLVVAVLQPHSLQVGKSAICTAYVAPFFLSPVRRQKVMKRISEQEFWSLNRELLPLTVLTRRDCGCCECGSIGAGLQSFEMSPPHLRWLMRPIGHFTNFAFFRRARKLNKWKIFDVAHANGVEFRQKFGREQVLFLLNNGL